MKNSVIPAVERILDSYLEMNNHRKTPERYAILRAVYSMNGHFTLDELGEHLPAGLSGRGGLSALGSYDSSERAYYQVKVETERNARAPRTRWTVPKFPLDNRLDI